MTQFQIGKTYTTRSICDHDCVFSAVVLARSANTVTVQLDGGRVVRRGVSEWNGAEMFYPYGRYSMAAIMRADLLLRN
jgi:hypothetical protein